MRTVYVLVLTGRENSEREDAESWLRLIAAHGTEPIDEFGKAIAIDMGSPWELSPPMSVALNKWDDHGSARPKVDRRALKERYPFIVDFVETDCATKTGIAKLRALLHATVDALAWVRAPFPEIYRKVKTALEAVGDPHLPGTNTGASAARAGWRMRSGRICWRRSARARGGAEFPPG